MNLGIFEAENVLLDMVGSDRVIIVYSPMKSGGFWLIFWTMNFALYLLLFFLPCAQSRFFLIKVSQEIRRYVLRRAIVIS